MDRAADASAEQLRAGADPVMAALVAELEVLRGEDAPADAGRAATIRILRAALTNGAGTGPQVLTRLHGVHATAGRLRLRWLPPDRLGSPVDRLPD